MRTLITTPRTIVPIRSRIGGNLVFNGNFEAFPSGTTATTSGKKWLDGTSGGSSTNDTYGWASGSASANAPVLIDQSTSFNGRPTLKLSTLATNNIASAYNVGVNDSLASIRRYAYKLPPGFYFSNYTLTYRMKTQNNSGTATTGATAGVAQWSDSGVFQGNSTNTGILTTQDWEQYSFTFQIQNASTRWLETFVEVKGNDGAATLIMDAWFTDISLKPTLLETRPFA